MTPTPRPPDTHAAQVLRWLAEHPADCVCRSTYPRRVRTRRSVIDYALQRRAVLVDLCAGRVSAIEVCDATPYLLRAAKYHGERTDRPCPVCRREPVWQVNYVYGDELKATAGQAKADRELPRMAEHYGTFRVYVIEVCRGCGWNHLTQSYVLGTSLADEDRHAAGHLV